MKNLLAAIVLALSVALPATAVAPTLAEAQVVQWQCSSQTYCNYYGCWQRTQCCAWVTDAWGNVAWRCEWR